MSETFIATPVTFDTSWGSRKVIDALRACQESIQAFENYVKQIISLDPKFGTSEGKDFLLVAQHHLAIEVGQLLRWSQNRTGAWKLWNIETLREEVKADQMPLLQNITSLLQLHRGFTQTEDLEKSILGSRIPSATPVELIVLLQIVFTAKSDLSPNKREEILANCLYLRHSVIAKPDPTYNVNIGGQSYPAVEEGRPKCVFVNLGTREKVGLTVATTAPAWRGYPQLYEAATQRRFDRMSPSAQRAIRDKIDKHRRNVATALTQTEKDNNVLSSQKLSQARKQVYNKMSTWGWNAIEGDAFNHPLEIAQAYSAFTFDFKPRCWSCYTLFHYHLVQNEHYDDVNWDGNDVEPSKPEERHKPRGKCAEALGEAKSISRVDRAGG